MAKYISDILPISNRELEGNDVDEKDWNWIDLFSVWLHGGTNFLHEFGGIYKV